MAASSAAFATLSPKKFDVFLSFSYDDTGDSFTSHLYGALCRRKLEFYIDDNFERGDEVSPETLKAIVESKISVIIFSENYADSSWCLDEMVQILHCKEKNGQLVVPIFYQVDPSHVQNQLENFISAITFKEHYKDKVQAEERKRKSDYKNKVNEWRAALTEFAKLPGWSSAHIRPESRLIDEVVQDVIKKLQLKSPSDDFKGLVGIHESIKSVESLLDISSPNDRIVGIWGMDDLGKTALATALFTQLKHRFDACCFLENVKKYPAMDREMYLLPHLLELLEDLPDLHIDTMSLQNHFKDWLQRKRVLLVLDDVDKREQLEILVGGRDWYGPGSRIIITSRRVELLENADARYEVPGLNPAEVLQLFVELHAFGKTSNNEDHLKLLSELVNVNCVNDIPRAIDILGSRLCGILPLFFASSIRQGESEPYYLAGQVLKAKYDGLDENMKSIFLDIVCFFQGDDKDVAKRILDGCGFSADRGINSLTEMSLVAITDCNKLYIHDSVREMGKDIVWQQSQTEPGWCSRLWDSQAIFHVFRTNTVTAAIEGIFLDMSAGSELDLSPTAFTNMVNLRILKFRNRFLKHKLQFRQGLQSLPDALRYLYWDGYPFESLPLEFSGKNLVELKMHYSKVEQLWNGIQRLENLKAIDLSFSEQLIQVPDLSGAPNIESVTLSYCVSLQEVPSYFGSLQKLTSLNLKGCSSLDKVSALPENVINVNLKRCESLKSLPSNIYTLKSLRRLELAGCSKFDYSKKFLEFLDGLKYNLET